MSKPKFSLENAALARNLLRTYKRWARDLANNRVMPQQKAAYENAVMNNLSPLVDHMKERGWSTNL